MFSFSGRCKKNSSDSLFCLSIVRQEQKIMLFEVLVRLKSDIAVIIFIKNP